MSVPRSPRWAIAIGLFFILSYLIVQLNRPLLFTLNVVDGKVVKYDYTTNKESKDTQLLIWLNDTISEPYQISYGAEQEIIKKELEQLKRVRIWINDDNEIKQLTVKDKKIIDYDWFAWLFTIFLGVGIIYHLIIYRLIKNESSNIKNYLDFWKYFFGEKPLIMKKTNRPFDPKDFSW